MLSEVLLELLPLPPAPPAPPAPCAEPLALVWEVLVALEAVLLSSLVDAVVVDEFEEVVKRRFMLLTDEMLDIGRLRIVMDTRHGGLRGETFSVVC